MIAQCCAAEDPREQFARGEVPPKRRRADKVFGCVHGKKFSVAQTKVWHDVRIEVVFHSADPVRNDSFIFRYRNNEK